MENLVCLDTDFLVNFLRNKQEEISFIEKNEEKMVFGTTYINLFELYYGAYKSGIAENIRKVEELEQRLRVLPFSKDAAKAAGKFSAELEKAGSAIDFRDLLIGVITLVEGFCLKTNNKRHFERIARLHLL